MSRALRITMLAGSAGIGLGLLIGTDLAASSNASAMQPVRYFDPVLSGALCTSDADSRRRLLNYYLKVAAATETKPFPPPAGEVVDAGSNAPLYDDLGDLSFPITAKNPLAQRYFDQGLRLTYGFNHAEARRAFRTAQKHDPDCAMCAWGEALVLGPNINAPMEADAVAPAIAAVRKARENSAPASAREQALIAAIAERYSSDPKAERRALDAAYATAMERVAAQFPDDDNIQTLYAEALMDLSPWDYWEAGGGKPKGRTQDIVRSLETVLARSPEHPGATHYYIHMMEASSAPERALPYARRLAAAVPGAGHLVHMPFHIYYRVGDYKAAVAANKAAVVIDEAYIAREKPVGIYPMAYYPHNVHSLMASAQMAGDGAAAVAAAEKLARIVSEDAARAVPMAQPIAVAHYFAHAQFSAPAVVLALRAPGDDLPFVKAMWHYARGVAYAARRDFVAGKAEANAIDTLERTADFSLLKSAGIPASEVLQLARAVIEGRLAQAEGDSNKAIEWFEQAAALQDALPYTEPPYWYYPVRQSLAAALMQAGRLGEAEEQFRRALVRAPNNGWSYYGMLELSKARGDAAAAQRAEAELAKTWVGDRRQLQISKL
jgi:tetratricopeptide (TPR) repeat protein